MARVADFRNTQDSISAWVRSSGTTNTDTSPKRLQVWVQHETERTSYLQLQGLARTESDFADPFADLQVRSLGNALDLKGNDATHLYTIVMSP